jgi:hypothetical protein
MRWDLPGTKLLAAGVSSAAKHPFGWGDPPATDDAIRGFVFALLLNFAFPADATSGDCPHSSHSLSGLLPGFYCQTECD